MNETLAVKDQLVLTFRNLITEIVAATPRVLVWRSRSFVVAILSWRRGFEKLLKMPC